MELQKNMLTPTDKFVTITHNAYNILVNYEATMFFFVIIIIIIIIFTETKRSN